MEIGGHELAFSLTNPEHVERLERAQAALVARCGGLAGGGAGSGALGQSEAVGAGAGEALGRGEAVAAGAGGYAAALREVCGALLEFFEEAFGEGSCNALFGEETDLDRCLEAYRAVEAALAAELMALEARLERYRPRG